MLLIYEVFLPLIALALSPVILIMLIAVPKFRAGFFQKLGFYKKTNFENTAVFHAVSVGETNAVFTAVKTYREENPDKKIVFSNTTLTGHNLACRILKDYVDEFCYFPFDFVFSVNSFFKAYNPQKVIIAETEIWPEFLNRAEKLGIEVYIANGRISPKSYNGYKKFSWFFKPILNKYTKILMQTKDDVSRIRDIGNLDENKVKFMGNLKFDISKNLNDDEQTQIKERFKAEGKTIFIAASTHAGEDEIALKVYQEIKKENPEIKMLIAPRHPERFEKVYNLLKLVENEGIRVGKVSQNATFDEFNIILGDTIGELSKFYSFAAFAFIGGSFSETGGHNPLEASIWNVPVISGKNIFNFKDVYKILTTKDAAVIVNTEEEFIEIAKKWTINKDSLNFAIMATQSVFEENRGAVKYLMREIN